VSNIGKFKLMQSSIVDFQNGVADINALRGSLKQIYWSMINPDKEWSDFFFDHWGTIEQLYALSASEGLSYVPGDRAEKIREAVRHLEKYIESELHKAGGMQDE
jgi:hypothetical protein